MKYPGFMEARRRQQMRNDSGRRLRARKLIVNAQPRGHASRSLTKNFFASRLHTVFLELHLVVEIVTYNFVEKGFYYIEFDFIANTKGQYNYILRPTERFGTWQSQTEQ